MHAHAQPPRFADLSLCHACGFADPFYMISVKQLSSPEVMVIKNRGMQNLAQWWVHFQEDIFLDVVEEGSFRFPTLQTSNRFYTVTFKDNRHRHYEVPHPPHPSTDDYRTHRHTTHTHTHAYNMLPARRWPCALSSLKHCLHKGKTLLRCSLHHPKGR